MTTATFVKRYPDPRRAVAARAHWDWLAALDCGVQLPALRSATPHELEFDHLGHRRPGPDHLGVLARALASCMPPPTPASCAPPGSTPRSPPPAAW